MIDFIVKFFVNTVMKQLRNLWNRFKRQQLKEDVKKKKEISNESVKEANDSYNDFMDEYNKYKSDGGDDKSKS